MWMTRCPPETFLISRIPPHHCLSRLSLNRSEIQLSVLSGSIHKPSFTFYFLLHGVVWAHTAISVGEGKCAEVAVVGAMTVWTNCSYHLLIPSGAAYAWFQMHCCYFIVGCSWVC